VALQEYCVAAAREQAEQAVASEQREPQLSGR